MPRIAAVVHERFGVTYTQAGLDLLLHRMYCCTRWLERAGFGVDAGTRR
jgi:Winged helix-turn helix